MNHEHLINQQILNASSTSKPPENGGMDALEMMESIDWLQNIQDLAHISSQQMTASKVIGAAESGPLAIDFHNAARAVVVSVEHYTTLLDAITNLKVFAEESVLAQKTEDFQQLYSQLTSEASSAAADSLFAASEEDLARSYKPGLTEQPTRKG